MSIRLVLADDHPLILDALENLFSLERDFQVHALCRDGIETLKAVREHHPDILVVDIRMPGKDGLQVAREMRADNLTTRLILLTAAIKDNEMMEALRLDVRGIVLKETAPRLLVQCIHRVYEGKQWIECSATSQARAKMMQQETGTREISTVLTSREIEIVHMVAAGIRNKKIADRLCISEGTVKVHLHNIFEKLNVDNRVAMLRYAQGKGIV